jgi:filamentous hemagglutinin family protein
MNRHGSMNRIYRLIWNDAVQAFVPAAETTRGRGKRAKRKLVVAATALATSLAQAGPTGVQVTAGHGTVLQSGSTTTVAQSSQNMTLTWQSFNVSADETVNFLQPSATSTAVNRILGVDGSVILGHINANGQVYLINPNGILFGRGAEVNVGGLVASTLNLDDSTLANPARQFKGSGTGSVSNEGAITAASGGSVTLLGNQVNNTGVVRATLGTVALGAGSAATLTFDGTRLVSMQVDQSVLNSVAANGGLLQANGGMVLMSAGSQKSLLASVVNNTGMIEARTLENHDGTITLLGGMTAGTIQVGGTLDASAPAGGDGGQIETSAAHVAIAGSAKVSTAAAMGLNGSWLIDPTDFTISAGATSQSASGVGATTLQNALSVGNVSISTSAGGNQNGDINVNAPVSWSSNTLTLTAANNINVNAAMTMSGLAKVDFEPGTGALLMGFASDGTFAGHVDISSSATNALTIQGQVYTVINSLGIENSTTATDLQGINGNLAGHYALGSNLDATATSGWSGGGGFATLGSITVNQNNGQITATNPFTGAFDGLGHTVSSLTIDRPYIEGDGLFAVTSLTSVIRNVGILDANVTGTQSVGLLVGKNLGAIANSFATGSATATEYNNGVPSVGGLVGINFGGIERSYAAVSVTGTANVGGLVGANYGSITASNATGSVHQVMVTRDVGGLVGANYGGSINDSYASADITSVAGGNQLGGLVGLNTGTLNNSFYNADVVNINGTHELTLGGLYNAQYVDWSTHGEVLNITNYASSLPVGSGGYYNVSSNQGFEDMLGFSENNAAKNFRLTADVSLAPGVYVPYFTGSFDGAGHTVSNLSVNIPTNDNIGLFGILPSSSTFISNLHVVNGNVTGDNSVGGLVGHMGVGVSLGGSSFSGSVHGYGTIGGLVGYSSGAITNSYSTGSVDGSEYVGGLVGSSYGSINSSFSSVSVTSTYYVGGGLTGVNGGTLSNSYASGAVSGAYYGGGLSGSNYGSISNSYSSGTVTGSSGLSGLTSYNSGTITNSFYNSTANPSLTGVRGTPDAPGIVSGLSAAQLQTQANFATAGWDLTGTWILYEGHTNPLLRAFMTPLVVGGGTTTKTYDGNAFAPSVSNLNYSIVPDPTLLFGTPTVGGSAIHAGSYIYTAAGLYSNQFGYSISYSPSVLTINPAALTVVGTSVVDKIYDGTTSATLTGGTLAGVVAGDTVTFSQTGTYASKNVGSGIVITASDTLGGSSASDYSITAPTGLTGTITPATLTVTGTAVGTKTYDGTTVASLSGGTLIGTLVGDTVTLNQSGMFASKNAASGIGVTATDTLGGAGAGNYTVVQPTGLSGTINPAALTVTGTSVGSRTYDGTTVASLTGGTLAGVIVGDNVTLSQTGTYASKNAGSGIGVTASDSLGGASASDYTIVQPVGLTGTIVPAELAVNGTTVAGKVADGSQTATLLNGMLSGIVAGDSVTLTQSGSFLSANPGSNIAVTATDSLGGASAGDYLIVQPTGLSGTIAPAITASVADSRIRAALNARSELETDFASSSTGPQQQRVIPSSSIEPIDGALLISAPGEAVAGNSKSGADKSLAVNVSMKIGATGSLKIENGGLRLPGTGAQGNE